MLRVCTSVSDETRDDALQLLVKYPASWDSGIELDVKRLCGPNVSGLPGIVGTHENVCREVWRLELGDAHSSKRSSPCQIRRRLYAHPFTFSPRTLGQLFRNASLFVGKPIPCLYAGISKISRLLESAFGDNSGSFSEYVLRAPSATPL